MLKTYSMINEKHKKMAMSNEPYTIPYFLAGQPVNIIIDYYALRVIEINPLDWENIIRHRAVIFSYGEIRPTMISETFNDYYRCRYLHTHTFHNC